MKTTYNAVISAIYLTSPPYNAVPVSYFYSVFISNEKANFQKIGNFISLGSWYTSTANANITNRICGTAWCILRGDFASLGFS